MSIFRDALSDRVLIFDGGMGAQLQGFDLPLSDYQGLENCLWTRRIDRSAPMAKARSVRCAAPSGARHFAH